VPNLGDEAIFDAIDAAAPKVDARITAFSTRSAGASDPRAVRPRGRGIFRYVKASTRADRVVLGGGGILKDEGLGPLLELLLAVALARLLRRQTALLAVGVGPFYTRTGRRLVAQLSRKLAITGWRSTRRWWAATVLANDQRDRTRFTLNRIPPTGFEPVLPP